MFEFARNKLSVQMKRIAPLVAVRRFVRREEGSSAVEFGLILLPFIAMMFAIMETAMVFFAQQTLETAVAGSARLIMTGQAQNHLPNALDRDTFKTEVCARIYGLFDCAKIVVKVNKWANFGGITYSAPTLDVNGNLDPTTSAYTPTGPGDIVVVQLFYQWPIFVTLMNLSSLVTSGNNTRLLVATAAFRNEPFN
jgi:Flp pilus assembly protein TadG